jgi:uncharacterized protein
LPRYHRPLHQATLFYGTAFSLALSFAALAPVIGRPVLFLTMFTPAIAVLLCRVARIGGADFGLKDLGLTRLGVRYWPLALSLPLLGLLPGYLIVWISGLGQLSLPVDLALPQLVVQLLISLIVGVALGAMGEEVGWRGYLLPRLAQTIGAGRASLITGFLHGCWHLPLIFLTPFYIADGPTALTVPLFLALTTFAGPIFGHMRLVSGSVVPAALMHAAWNSAWSFLSGVTQTENRSWVACLAGESGIVSVAMLALIAIWISRRAPVAVALRAA